MFIMKRNEASYSFLLFTIQAQHFAMPLENLVEVTEGIHVSSLPFVPDYVDGLINLSSQIIPQINAQQLLFSHLISEPSHNSSEQETLLVFKHSGPFYALNVNYVLDSVTIDADNIVFNELLEDTSTTLLDQQNYRNDVTQASLIEGLLNYTDDLGNNIEALIFSPENAEAVIAEQNNQLAEDSVETGFLGELSSLNLNEQQTEEYLIFTIGTREFATKLTDILEVTDLTSVQKSQHGIHEGSDIIAGVALVRDNPLAVLDLRHWLKTNAGKVNISDTESVIILSHEQYYCSIAIDSITGMIEINDQQTLLDPDTQQLMLKIAYSDEDKTTDSLSENIQENSEDSLFNHKLIEIFSTEQLIQSPLFQAIETLLPKRQNTYEAPVKTLDILKFSLHRSTYGILIDDIQRVINNQHIEPLLSPKAFISGSCEYDGLVIPVIDLTAQLSIHSETKSVENTSLLERIQQQPRTHSVQQEAIVVEHKKQSWALAINESECIIEVKETDIDFLPEREQQLIKAYASFGTELVHLLNVDAICAYNT